MRILVIGLQGLGVEQLLGDERLIKLHRLMEIGCFGRLEGCAGMEGGDSWMVFASSRKTVRSDVSSSGEFVWDYLAGHGRRSILAGLPLFYPRPVAISKQVEDLAVEFPDQPFDLYKENDGDPLEELVSVSAEQFGAVHQLLVKEQWDYFQFVDSGLDRLWNHFSEQDLAQDQQAQKMVMDYLNHLDEQLGQLFELLTDDTILTILSIQSVGGTNCGFILAAAINPMQGEISSARLIDIAPTLLKLGGYEIPAAMEGKSLVGDLSSSDPGEDLSAEEEQILRERLSGLGYIG